MTVAQEHDVEIVMHYLSGNFDSHEPGYDGYLIRKGFEDMVSTAVMRERLDVEDYSSLDKFVSLVWGAFIERELQGTRGRSAFVDSFLPTGDEWWVRDAIAEEIKEIAEWSK